MGEQIKRPYVSFEPNGNSFLPFVSLDAINDKVRDLESLLNAARLCYETHLWAMRALIGEMQELRRHRKLIPARKMWAVGDHVVSLVAELNAFGLQLDGVYDHVCRDLGVKRKWLEKAITFRRHIPSEEIIPDTLPWGRCEKGTRKVAQKIKRGEAVV